MLMTAELPRRVCSEFSSSIVGTSLLWLLEYSRNVLASLRVCLRSLSWRRYWKTGNDAQKITQTCQAEAVVELLCLKPLELLLFCSIWVSCSSCKTSERLPLQYRSRQRKDIAMRPLRDSGTGCSSWTGRQVPGRGTNHLLAHLYIAASLKTILEVLQ